MKKTGHKYESLMGHNFFFTLLSTRLTNVRDFISFCKRLRIHNRRQKDAAVTGNENELENDATANKQVKRTSLMTPTILNEFSALINRFSLLSRSSLTILTLRWMFLEIDSIKRVAVSARSF